MADPTPYTAHVRWQRQAGEPFTDNRYNRRHEWRFDGGAVVPGSSSPHSVRLPYSDASAVDPEEALVAAASSCHLLTFLYLAAKAGWLVDAYEDDAVGLMARNEQGRLAITHITLRPAIRFGGAREPTAAELAQLHHDAHEQCYIANSLKSEIVCEPRPAP
jgi:organic hydroperoxide reductase OsmC/OhrA